MSDHNETYNEPGDTTVVPPTTSLPDQPTTAESPAPDIFDERFVILMGGFGETCETNNVKLAIAVAVDPLTNVPVVFLRGDTYQLARLTKSTLDKLRTEIMHILGG